MEFYIAQGISILTCVVAIIMMQFKSMKKILIGQIIANLLTASTYFLLGGISGAGICFIAIIQTTVMFILNKKNISVHTAVVALFIFLYIGCSIVYYKTPADILSALAAVCFAISVIQSKPSLSRIWYSFNPLCWIIYDIFNLAYVNLAMHLVVFVSVVISILRNDLKKNVN